MDDFGQEQCPTVFGIRIRSTGVCCFFANPDPDSTFIFSDSQDQEKYFLFLTVGTSTSVLRTDV
jgi:hypothetical protein